MRIILAYKNFAIFKHVSHIGLGVAAEATAQELRKKGIIVDVWQIRDGVELRQRLNSEQTKLGQNHRHLPITHVVISAPFIDTAGMNSLCHLFPRIQFSMCSHSNVGFLQADPHGVKLIREALDLEMITPNFRLAGNSIRFKQGIEAAYGRPCAYLPNLYHYHKNQKHKRPRWSPGQTLRVGIFGATRPLKNIPSAVWAALAIQRELNCPMLIHMNTGRSEGGGDVVLRAVQAMVQGINNVHIVECGWNTWPRHRDLVGSMHLLFQPSYTESFNMVTADGIAEGVPSVVSEAIDWVPASWIAHVDDVCDMARVGVALVQSKLAPFWGRRALDRYTAEGVKHWMEFLEETSWE